MALTGAVMLALARAQAGAVPARAAEDGLFGDVLGFSAAIGYAGYLLSGARAGQAGRRWRR